MNAQQIAAASTAELVTFYNQHAARPVKKFQDRATAERRVAELAATLKPAAAKPAAARKYHPNDGCPACGAKHDQTAAGQDGTVAGDERSLCHHCGTEYWTNTGKVYKAPAKSANASASIAASWNDPAVRAARSERTAVSVSKGAKAYGQFASVAKAFAALHLSAKGIIRTRMTAKAQGTAEYEGYTFTVGAQ